tara:strand:- start:23 stop:1069 length:1047 start_codon:yes stop_codon:yes gene_type:complete
MFFNPLEWFFLFIYWFLSILNSFLFKIKLKKTVVFPTFILSVGNLSFGGAGKTPMIELLSAFLSSEGLSHSIISRGYGRKNFDNLLVSDKRSIISTVSDAGDEPFLLANSLVGVPVAVGNKLKTIPMLLNLFSSKVILVDDGFQTFSLSRNLDIVLIDCSVNINYYRLFPLGFLREPVACVSRAHLVVFTKCNYDSGSAKKIKSLVFKYINKKNIAVFEADYFLSLKKYSLKNLCFIDWDKKISSPVVAFCGIAQSNIFTNSLLSFCENLIITKTFPDHASYSKRSIKSLQVLLQKHARSVLVTTRKDFFKIREALKGYTIYVVDVEHKIKETGTFQSFLRNRFIDLL